MKQLRNFVGLASTLLLCISTASAQNNFAIKDGDRVVFYGDSITDSRQYTTITETYILTRFPNIKVDFTHSGWSGDRVSGGGGGNIDVRLKRDVLTYKPTVMTIMLGMNDGSYRAFDQKIFDTYATGYQKIIDTVKQGAPGVRITAIQPSPYDDVTRPVGFEGGYNAVLVRYGQFIKELGAKENLTVSDMNTPVVAMLQKANAIDPAQAQKLIGDRVHPGPGGHLIMAEALLKSWNAPSIVTSVTIDAAAKKVGKTENTAVSDFKAENGLSWTQADGALPYPIAMTDAAIALAVKASDVVDALNQQPLKVTGLAAGNYTLKIDEEEVGTFTADQLAAGVNLAMLQTPMVKQAAKVHGLTWQRTGVHQDRWRNLQVPLEKDDFPAVKAAVQTALPTLLSVLDAKDAYLAEQQRATAKPLPRKYSLVPKP